MYQANVLSPLTAGGNDRILLRTLTNLRWMAIAGQSAALIVAPTYFGLNLPLGVCTMAVGLSVMANLVFMIASPDNKRLTETEAMRLMQVRGHQEEGEAVGKWRRALLTSTQLSTYYVGYVAVHDLVRDLRAANPGWSDRQVHDAVLAHGSPPPRHLRTLLGL